jgi:hypothetical protein
LQDLYARSDVCEKIWEHIKKEEIGLKKKAEIQRSDKWQRRLGKALKQLGKKNSQFSEKEVAADVDEAVKKVRTAAG